MPKFNVLAQCLRVLSRLLGVSAVAIAIPFQQLAAATVSKIVQGYPTLLAQASQAEPQSAPSQSVPQPETQPPTAPSPPSSSAIGPGTPTPRIEEMDKRREGTPATVVDGQQLESILGKDVLSPRGENMGRIVDIIVDRTGQPRAAIVDFGGFLGVGTRKIAIDWRMIRFRSNSSMDNVVVDLARDQLRVAPIFKPGDPVVIIGRPDPTR
jgi:PRC-barrel domain